MGWISRAWASRRETPRRVRNASGSLFHDFLRFLVREFRDLLFVGLEEALHLLFALVALVFGQSFGLFGLLEAFIGIAANVAASDLGLFGRFLDAGDHLLPLLTGHRRHRQANQLAVAVGGHAEVAGAD